MSQPLWVPSDERIENSNMMRFMRQVNDKFNQEFSRYHDLYQWSVDNIEEFWPELFETSGLICSARYTSVLSEHVMPGARWFEGARLNFAENLLRYRDDRPAIVHWREDSPPEYLNYRELYQKVAACAAGLKRLGVEAGDRVVGYLPNIPETVIAMLATTSLGALWSSCSPDFGAQGVYDRFGQIEPKILIVADGYRYQGKVFGLRDRISKLRESIGSVEKVIVINVVETGFPDINDSALPWESLLEGRETEMTFHQAPFDQPVYIMYSSGTTGKPKCIVHGAGGTLLQHWKEQALHTDMSRDDVLFYYTTCGWMMWNWLVSGLQIGATIFLYDGSPGYPSLETFWRAIEQEKVTVFGTSPKFLSICQKQGLEPGKSHDMSSLKTILSTGSPLSAENFRWVYDKVKSDLQLSSISGGTDIVSCFMLGNPVLPVYSEEIQSRGLGMKVETFDEHGKSVSGEIGELVCSAPFPSMPVSFWNDPDGSKYRAAYFEKYPGIWCHGDFIKITEHDGVIVYGRSDATLNPGGVRIGTAEIYGPVEALDQVTDSVVVGQKWKGDLRIVLFVVLRNGLKLDEKLIGKIKSAIRKSATARHVPPLILQVKDIPRTISGKKVEIAVTRMIHGQQVTNREALSNPEALDEYKDIPELA
ncbi:MAG: acetoacetate--CoA ligase [candidate division Zixibacteria bacterium]|nr:acetoacetate--CoA ligase [candidate division Zixibacteria bacterium]